MTGWKRICHGKNRAGESRLLQPLESSWTEGAWRGWEDTHCLWTSGTIGAKGQKREMEGKFKGHSGVKKVV